MGMDSEKSKHKYILFFYNEGIFCVFSGERSSPCLGKGMRPWFLLASPIHFFIVNASKNTTNNPQLYSGNIYV